LNPVFCVSEPNKLCDRAFEFYPIAQSFSSQLFQNFSNSHSNHEDREGREDLITLRMSNLRKIILFFPARRVLFGEMFFYLGCGAIALGFLCSIAPKT